MRPKWFLCLLMTVTPACAAAQQHAGVSGTVSTVEGLPVVGAELSLSVTAVTVISDPSGRFSFPSLPATGEVRLRARAVGFTPLDTGITIEPGRGYSVVLVMKRLAQQLDPVVTQALLLHGKPARYANTSKFDDFYERRARRPGSFFTLEDLERIDQGRVVDLLRSVPGIIVSTPGGDTHIRVARCTATALGKARGPQAEGDPKWLAVYLNGQRISDGIRMLSQLHPRDIEAMEVYRGASQLPPEAVGNACAAIFVWSRYTVGPLENK